jgi:hypothetical protein
LQIRDGSIVPKQSLLGNVSFTCKISNVFNYLREGIDSENRLNNAINRRATQIPQFKAIKLAPLIEDSLRNSLKRENIDDYVDSAALKAMDDSDLANAVAPQQAQQAGVPQAGPSKAQGSAGNPTKQTAQQAANAQHPIAGA